MARPADDTRSRQPTGARSLTDRAEAAIARAGIDRAELDDWLAALRDVVRVHGAEVASHIVEAVVEEARLAGSPVSVPPSTPYVNTIPVEQEPPLPGDPDVERRLRSIVRWNAVAMVLRANMASPGIGGHIASFQSAATLYETGFNHFWHATTDERPGDLVYMQGHSSPGIYARAFLEGRIDEEQVRNFRRETGGEGLSSYPHPWLMPNFWRFPTVSMGLGPIMSIYQARFLKYLENRGLLQVEGRKVWAFMGDGEMDEPESIGAISLAARERLDNLIFVINCNLQRLDGPVRGNGKIVQELETLFRGAGWNVIKVLWGERWDPLLEADHDGLLRRRMTEAVDGEYQVFKSRDGRYVRDHFFGAYPELAERVKDMSDEEIFLLNRGGHSPRKVHAAYDAAVRHRGEPTVILAKTVKGYGMGRAGEGMNIAHQAKKMEEEALLAFRDRFGVPLSDDEAKAAAFYRPPEDSPEMRYMRERRERLGGGLPSRGMVAPTLEVPELSVFDPLLRGTDGREISTTMAYVRALGALVRDKSIGRHIVPIVADESRTFGMEGMFRQIGIYSPVGQRYEPEDASQLMFYREDEQGQILQEGITEAGAFSSWIAAATSYAVNGVTMIPFFILYSMFGFQRIGDLAWAAGDSRARGFLIGATSGRTTLNGEGLQHQDGHSHLLASVVPNCRAYDPAYAYELAVIVHDGLRRMVAEQEDVYYYVTTLNENYAHPAMPEGAEQGIVRGMHRVRAAADEPARVRLLGSGSILREVLAAADILEEEHGVAAEVHSVTSFTELRRDGMEAERWSRLHPTEPRRVPWVAEQLAGDAPVVASTDYMRAVPDQIRPYVPAPMHVLGTDGFGRSDSREALRRFFEIDRHHVVATALWALADRGEIAPADVDAALDRYEIDREDLPPWRR